MLKTRPRETPQLLWDWFEDEYRIGECGFFMLSDQHMVFGSYPAVYSLRKGESPELYVEVPDLIKQLRMVDGNRMLLLGDESVYLTEQNGTVVKHWDSVIDEDVQDAPLNRNQIFDADYANGELLLSYWGARSFDVIDAHGNRERLLLQTEPLTPHWVAFRGDKKLLFSSELVFDGSTPKPHLILLDEHQNTQVIWNEQ